MNEPGEIHFTHEEIEIVLEEFKHEEFQTEDGVLHRVRTKVRKTWRSTRDVIKTVGKVAKREKEETAIAAVILKKYLLTRKITKEEAEFLKGQSKDLARILPIVAAQAVPAPVPITPFLITLGSKIGIDLIPKEQIRPGSAPPFVDEGDIQRAQGENTYPEQRSQHDDPIDREIRGTSGSNSDERPDDDKGIGHIPKAK